MRLSLQGPGKLVERCNPLYRFRKRIAANGRCRWSNVFCGSCVWRYSYPGHSTALDQRGKGVAGNSFVDSLEEVRRLRVDLLHSCSWAVDLGDCSCLVLQCL